MKERYRLFLRRKSVYYAFDNQTKLFHSLKTRDKAEANRLLVAMNEAGRQPAMNLSLARVYLRHSDPMVSQRTWQNVADEIIKTKTGPTQDRWQRAANDEAFDSIRNRAGPCGRLAALISLRQPTARAATGWITGGPCRFPSRLAETTMRSFRLLRRPAAPIAIALWAVYSVCIKKRQTLRYVNDKKARKHSRASPNRCGRSFY
jgi:hypothetical protein